MYAHAATKTTRSTSSSSRHVQKTWSTYRQATRPRWRSSCARVNLSRHSPPRHRNRHHWTVSRPSPRQPEQRTRSCCTCRQPPRPRRRRFFGIPQTRKNSSTLCRSQTRLQQIKELIRAPTTPGSKSATSTATVTTTSSAWTNTIAALSSAKILLSLNSAA